MISWRKSLWATLMGGQKVRAALSLGCLQRATRWSVIIPDDVSSTVFTVLGPLFYLYVVDHVSKFIMRRATPLSSSFLLSICELCEHSASDC